MDKKSLINGLTSDYYNFFSINEVDSYRKEMYAFIKEKEDLTDDEFFKEFYNKFYLMRVANDGITRSYLENISNSIKTIKIIVIIYFIFSIIGAIVILIHIL